MNRLFAGMVSALMVWGGLLSPVTPAAGEEAPKYVWINLGLGGGGGMFSPAISPLDGKLMFISCDMGGLYRSADGGRTWRMVNFRQLAGNTQCAPVFHPTDVNTIYAADGHRGLCVSHDKGVTWEPVTQNPPWGRSRITALGIGRSDPSLLLVGTADAAYISSDTGKRWSKCRGPEGQMLGFHVAEGTPRGRSPIIFAASGKGVWRSDDGGKTWALKTKGLPWTDIRSFCAGRANDKRAGTSVLFVTIPSREVKGKFAGGVYRSGDGGETWQSAMGGGINTRLGKIDRWGAGDIAQYRHLAMAGNQTQVVYVSNYGTGYWPPYHNTVYRSADSGKTWQFCFTGDPRREGTNVELGWYTYDILWDPGDWGMAASGSNPDQVIHAGGKLYLTNDGGRSWHQAYTRRAPGQGPLGKGQRWQSTGLEVTTTWDYVIDPSDRQKHYICYTDIGFARSTDGGQTWISSREGCPWKNTWYGTVCDPERPGVIYAACANVHDIPHSTYSTAERRRGPGGVCLSTDYGATWKSISEGLPDAPVTSIVMDPTSAADARTLEARPLSTVPPGARNQGISGSPAEGQNRRSLYVTSIGHGVYKSVDSGRRWVKKSKGLGAPENRQVWMVQRYHDGTLYACVTCARKGSEFPTVGTGLYKSTDGAETWEHISKSLEARPLSAVPPGTRNERGSESPPIPQDRRGLRLGWPTGFAVHPDDPNIIYLAASCGWHCQTGGLYKTTDGGRSWSCIFNKQSSEYLGRGLESFFVRLHPANPEVVYYSTGTQGLMLSRDGGQHWEFFDDLPFDNIHRVTFDPDDENIIYVSTFGSGVWRGPALPIR